MEDLRHSHLLHTFLSIRARLAALIYRRVGCRATTADLTQDTFLKLWERRANLSDVSDVGGYFIVTGRNLAADYERRKRIAPLIVGIEELERLVDTSPTAEEVAIGRDELRRVLKAIESLPPKCKQVFLLSRFEDKSYVEIARELGLSPKTVFSHMVTALERLRAEMSATPVHPDNRPE